MSYEIDYSKWDAHVRDVIEINSSKESVYEYVYNNNPRPNYLPNYECKLIYNNPVIQEFKFEIKRDDGVVLTVRTISRCDGDIIEFFQSEPSIYVKNFFVQWTFESVSDKKCKIYTDTYWNLNENSYKRFFEKDGLSIEKQMQNHFSKYSILALEMVKQNVER